MTAFLMLLKACVVVLATALALASVGRRSSPALRHLICTLGIAGLLALPLLSMAVPPWLLIQVPALVAAIDRPKDAPERLFAAQTPIAAAHINAHAAPIVDPSFVTPPRIARRSPARPMWMLLTPFWLLPYGVGVLLLLIRIVVDRFSARRLVRNATQVRDLDWRTLFEECSAQLQAPAGVRLMCSPQRATPMAVGIRRPAIVLPEIADEWPQEMRRVVLLHELAHVVRRDCLTQTAAAIVCALYWVHPGSWWLARRLRVERELACDDLVLVAGTDAHDYARQLLELAYILRGLLTPALAVGMAGSQQLETRMLAILDAARNRTAPTPARRIAALVLFIALIVPVAGATALAVSIGDAAAQAGTRATHDVSADSVRAQIDRVLSVDYWRHTATEQFNRLVDQLNYLTEMRQLGYSVADVNVLFKLRQHGVTPQFVRALTAEGLSGLPTDDLLTAVSHGVSAEYIHDLKGLGYEQLDIETLTRLRSHGISPDYIRDMETFGYHWSVDELTSARSHGVDPDYLRQLSWLGYQHLSIDDLTLLRSHGVTVAQVRSANERAGSRLSVAQLTDRASHGWKP